MDYKYTLPEKWIEKTRCFGEFRMGAMQVTVKTIDGTGHEKVLLSNCQHPIAMRGYADLPFKIEDVANIFQTAEDKWPESTGN